ncbi:MAG TPA: DUF2846 domain-containing protein [Rectinemataceae bacterium]|nr:DUF2846 domain-containing protein [Rectinemataceae bacterium]
MAGRIRISVLLLGTLIAGLAMAQAASKDAEAAAKSFAPPDGKVNIYVSRDTSSFGKLIQFKVLVDDKELGSIAQGTFFLIVVDPGKHSVKVVSTTNTAKAELDTVAGKNYFFEVKAVSGFPAAQASMSRVIIDAMGRLMVTQSTLAQTVVQ